MADDQKDYQDYLEYQKYAQSQEQPQESPAHKFDQQMTKDSDPTGKWGAQEAISRARNLMVTPSGTGAGVVGKDLSSILGKAANAVKPAIGEGTQLNNLLGIVSPRAANVAKMISRLGAKVPEEAATGEKAVTGMKYDPFMKKPITPKSPTE